MSKSKFRQRPSQSRSKMIPFRGLSSEEIRLPRKRLRARNGIYFSAVMMCMWDNIHGPRVLNVWTGDEPVPSLQIHKVTMAGLDIKDKESVSMEKLSKSIKEQLAASRSDVVSQATPHNPRERGVWWTRVQQVVLRQDLGASNQIQLFDVTSFVWCHTKNWSEWPTTRPVHRSSTIRRWRGCRFARLRSRKQQKKTNERKLCASSSERCACVSLGHFYLRCEAGTGGEKLSVDKLVSPVIAFMKD